jgi:hypothetical protein
MWFIDFSISNICAVINSCMDWATSYETNEKSSHQFRIIRFYKLIYIKKLTWSSSGQLVQILLIFIFLNGVVLISILIFFLNWINPPNLYL